MQRRAVARFKDKQRAHANAGKPFHLSEQSFVRWYTAQPDRCSYCGTTFKELAQLRLRRSFGYYVSWDIDRIDSAKPYRLGNLALACFICNMAKADYLSYSEAKVLGRAVRRVLRARLLRLPPRFEDVKDRSSNDNK